MDHWRGLTETEFERSLLDFEAAWRIGTAPDLDAYLSAPSPSGDDSSSDLRVRQLLELVPMDLEYRWRTPAPARSGSMPPRPRLEHYLARYPELRALAGPPIVLVGAEYYVRWIWGDGPDEGEYLRRFPGFADSILDELRRVDAAIAEEQSGLESESQRPLAPMFGPPQGPFPANSWPVIAGLECLGEIGRGSMGVVYKARDLLLGRIVAIKTIAKGQHAAPEWRNRFQAEARAVARLRHPNIIAIHRIGEHQNEPYLSLEFADGGDLDRRLAEKPMVPREAAALVETLARAIHVVHQAGIVHRDLQPRNVLITSDGTPKITDFGLAKLLDTNSECTASGLIMGTPSYIAPEQAGGHSREVGPAADIYALGAILYKALTGRPPFLGSSALETLKLVSTTEVAPPARLRPDVPKDLETICLKCLQKEPPKRYTSGEALAGDLRRFLEGRPITARPVGLAERFRRWCRRNPKMAAVATLLAATVLLAISVFVGLTYRHNRELRAEIRRTQIKAAEARHHYEEARSTIQAMLNRLDARRLDGVPQFMDLCREQREDASSFYDRILEVIDSADPEVRADTARAWSEASVLEYRLGHREQAEQSVRRALRLVEGMRADGRDHPEFLKIQIDCLMRLGAYMIDLERPEQAIATSRESVTLAERLTESAHDDQNYKSLLALCHHNHANALWDSRNASKDEPTRQRMVEEAKRHYQKAIEIRESLDPKVIPGLAQRLSQGYTNLGIVDWNEGQNTQAERDFGRADELLRSSSPEVLGPGDNFSLESSLLYLNWAGMLCTVGRFDEAIDKADDGLKWIDPYLQSQPNHLGARRACLGLHGNRAGALAGKGKHAESAREWARVIELSDRPVPVKPRVSIAIELAQAGDLAHALGHAQHVKSSDGISGQDCHNLAYLYSLCATAARGDQSIRPAQRNERVQSHIAEAVRWLKAAAKAGLYDDAKLLLENKNDPGFEILRDRPEFREIFGSSGPKP